MLRRCVRELSSRRQIAAQIPFFLSSRNEFATVSQKNSPQKPAPVATPVQETTGSGSSLTKLALGVVVVGAAGMVAYQSGLVDFGSKGEKASLDLRNLKSMEHSHDQTTSPSFEKTNVEPNAETGEKNENQHLADLVNKETGSEIKPEENESPSLSEETQAVHSETSSEDNLSRDHNAVPDVEQKNTAQSSVDGDEKIDSWVHVSKEGGMDEAASHHDTSLEMPKVSRDTDTKAPKSLTDSYSLQKVEGISETFNNDKEVSITTSLNSKDKSRPDDEKLVLGLIEAIHAAEERQAETDAYIFAEEKRKLKEKYEKELKDARARELMYAEEAAILEKELNKEKAKAEAMIKSLQEKAEQKLQEELHQKEEEADIQLQKVQELAKAELAAAIANEKASQIEKIAEANLNINALCMAFYARSEEARQSHSVHKLALGTLALEDALSKGLPIRAEVDALQNSLEGIDKDSLLALVLSSLPEETINFGTSTYTQLNQKFDSLKGTLRHFSLIPAGGGGLLTHAVAHIASSIKMKEDQSGDGVESAISKIESFLVQGKFAEAADALEGVVRGSEAEEVATEWVMQARNRAVVEQALSLLRSYTTSITF